MSGNSSIRETLLEQQRALAEFGVLALRADDLTEILTEACRLVAKALHTFDGGAGVVGVTLETNANGDPTLMLWDNGKGSPRPRMAGLGRD